LRFRPRHRGRFLVLELTDQLEDVNGRGEGLSGDVSRDDDDGAELANRAGKRKKRSGHYRRLQSRQHYLAERGPTSGSEDPRHRLAFDIFVDRVSAFVGSYFVSLEGQVDALVFAGGIGEKSAKLRAAVVRQVRCLGFEIDSAKNENLSVEGVVEDITAPSNNHKVLVCQTDEQFEMAKTCADMDKLWD
jgi:hypothetical protein